MVAVFRAPASTQHGDAYRPVRFVIAGLLNTLFGFVIFSAAIAARVPVWAALLAGLLVGIAFNFVTTGGYVFRNLSRRRFPRFLACYLCIYAINLAGISVLHNWSANHIVSQAIFTLPMAALSYFLLGKFVFPPTPFR